MTHKHAKCGDSFSTLKTIGVALLIVTLFGCGKKDSADPLDERPLSGIAWDDTFRTNQGLILTGAWDKAEIAWGTLKSSALAPWQAKEWIQLQTQILERTTADPYRSNMREVAIQEMLQLRYQETARVYLPWLKSNLDLGLFNEPPVHKIALRVLDTLEKMPSPAVTNLDSTHHP